MDEQVNHRDEAKSQRTGSRPQGGVDHDPGDGESIKFIILGPGTWYITKPITFVNCITD